MGLMMKRLGIFIVILVGAIAYTAGCGDPIKRKELNQYRVQNRYVDKQELVTQTAFLALEVDGKLKYDFKGNLEDGGYASGFLISKKRGLFKTAYHVSKHLGESGVDWCRLFMNGKVYRAGLYRASSNRDSAVIRIIDNFDPADFPEPPPVATERVKVGDKVFIEGHHPHPYDVRLRDKEAGKNFILIPLLKNYYQTVRVDREDYTEVVYEVLEAEVTEIDVVVPKKEGDDSIESRVHKFFTIRTKEDHFFSFGGLSGTVIKNDKGEVVGEVTMGPAVQVENRIIHVTPIQSSASEIRDLFDNYQP